MLLAVGLGCRPAASAEPPVPPTPPAWALAAHHHGAPLVVAHRGASAFAPENTLASYREALARGALAAETDVHLSADGRVVVMHDPTVERTTGVPGAVAEMTWDALRALDAGAWFGSAFAGEPVPELGEVLDLVRGRMVLCVEIKAGAGVVEAVRAEVDARAMRPDVVVFSFDPAAVAAAKAAMPDVPAVLLIRRQDTPGVDDAVLAQARALRADAVGFDHRALTPSLVEVAHAAGLPVFSWVVNDAADLERVVAWGVDVVISDAPDRVAGWLAAAVEAPEAAPPR